MCSGSRPYAGLTQGEIVHRICLGAPALAFPHHTPQVRPAMD